MILLYKLRLIHGRYTVDTRYTRIPHPRYHQFSNCTRFSFLHAKFAQIKNNVYLCSAKVTRPRNTVAPRRKIGGHIIKGVKYPLCLATWNLANSKIIPTHCSILISSGYVYLYPYTPQTGVCGCTYRRGLGVACSE